MLSTSLLLISFFDDSFEDIGRHSAPGVSAAHEVSGHPVDKKSRTANRFTHLNTAGTLLK